MLLTAILAENISLHRFKVFRALCCLQWSPVLQRKEPTMSPLQDLFVKAVLTLELARRPRCYTKLARDCKQH